MDRILNLFGAIYRKIAGLGAILLIVIAVIAGFIICGGTRMFVAGLIGAILYGILAFVFDIFTFGFIGMVMEIYHKAESLEKSVKELNQRLDAIEAKGAGAKA